MTLPKRAGQRPIRRRPRKSPEEMREERLQEWVPKTEAGRLVKEGLISSLEDLKRRKIPILEPMIIDALLPDLQTKPLYFNRTTRLRDSGRQFSQQSIVAVGNRNGWVGIGKGKGKNGRVAVEKAEREAKLSIVQVPRGSGSWEDHTEEQHSVPIKLAGKQGSVRVTLQPAPRGTGIVAGETAKEILRLAGIKDVWVKTKGNTRTVSNFAGAIINALDTGNKQKDLLKRPEAREDFDEIQNEMQLQNQVTEEQLKEKATKAKKETLEKAEETSEETPAKESEEKKEE